MFVGQVFFQHLGQRLKETVLRYLFPNEVSALIGLRDSIVVKREINFECFDSWHF
jgi:hypothetical protein